MEEDGEGNGVVVRWRARSGIGVRRRVRLEAGRRGVARRLEAGRDGATFVRASASSASRARGIDPRDEKKWR